MNMGATTEEEASAVPLSRVTDACDQANQRMNGRSSDSPDGRDEAGASSGESNTREQGQQQQAQQTHQGPKQAVAGQPAASAAPSNQGNSETGGSEQQQGKEGRVEKNGKLPRPEGTACCPRCASEDTKFCYYNNYNVKQPRYFCKACQRYWTAGGTLRNVPVGAGRRKNKNAAARSGDSERDKAKASSKASTSSVAPLKAEPSFGTAPFSPLMLEAMAYPPMAPGKARGLPGFMPSLPGAMPLNPLAAVPGFQTIVDPAAAAAAAAALPARLAAGVDPMQFMAPAMPCSSARSGCQSGAGEDGSCDGRRVRMRKDSAGPADSSQHGSACTAADMGRSLDFAQLGSGPAIDPCGSSLSGFQPFGGSSGAQVPGVSAPMAQQDWFSMAAAASQQSQAQAAQLQYQAAAMQAQAMQAAAAGAWGQGGNPYLSGLCFPYANIYSAGPQWAAAYASLGAQPWGTMGDMTAAQGSGTMPSSIPASSAPSQSNLGTQAWGGNTGSAWAPANSVVWPGWPSQGMEQQQQHQMQQQQHSNQQQQQMDMHGLASRNGGHNGMQHSGGGMLQHSSMHHGSHNAGSSGLHGAGSSMFSGNSGATVFNGNAANGHHNSQSLDTGN